MAAFHEAALQITKIGIYILEWVPERSLKRRIVNTCRLLFFIGVPNNDVLYAAEGLGGSPRHSHELSLAGHRVQVQPRVRAFPARHRNSFYTGSTRVIT